jgi:hypothetical protein
MLILAGAILIAAAIISITLARGFRHMVKTVTDAAADLSAAVSRIAAAVAADLQAIADSISEHVANGTAVTAIEAQVDTLNNLSTQLEAGETPAPPADTTTAPEPVDTVAGGNGDDSISA